MNLIIATIVFIWCIAIGANLASRLNKPNGNFILGVIIGLLALTFGLISYNMK